MAKHDIMIVDDNPANLKLLEDMLVQQGHKVRSFPLGRLALSAAMKQQPDLILLDINMPEMDGYEVCGRLKSDPNLSLIPVIFLSALNETQDKVKAFRTGAVDYVSKPFQFEEVQARVETHLQLHRLQRALKKHNERLEETVAARTAELSAANERLTILDRSKSDFLSLLSHEFRTPLNGLLGAGEMILQDMPPTSVNLQLCGVFERSRARILEILDDALLLNQVDLGRGCFNPAPVLWSAAVNHAIDQTLEFAKSRQVTLAVRGSDEGSVVGDEPLLARALHALLETAVKFSERGENLRLQSEVAAGSRTVVIESTGRTIPDALLPKFFEIFAIAETITPGGDLGLAPAVASRILSLFGGSVSVANRDPSGIRLTVLLKDAAAPHTLETSSGR